VYFDSLEPKALMSRLLGATKFIDNYDSTIGHSIVDLIGTWKPTTQDSLLFYLAYQDSLCHGIVDTILYYSDLNKIGKAIVIFEIGGAKELTGNSCHACDASSCLAVFYNLNGSNKNYKWELSNFLKPFNFPSMYGMIGGDSGIFSIVHNAENNPIYLMLDGHYFENGGHDYRERVYYSILDDFKPQFRYFPYEKVLSRKEFPDDSIVTHYDVHDSTSISFIKSKVGRDKILLTTKHINGIVEKDLYKYSEVANYYLKQEKAMKKKKN
jgi:hypothetical protein